MELRAYLAYRRRYEELTFWRAKNGQEVDFVVGEELAIEVKATARISMSSAKGLKALQEENLIKKLIVVSQDRVETHQHGVQFMHWHTFIRQLWSDELITPE